MGRVPYPEHEVTAACIPDPPDYTLAATLGVPQFFAPEGLRVNQPLLASNR